MERRAAGIEMLRNRAIERRFQSCRERSARGGGRLGHSRRRHHAGAQLAHDFLPHLGAVVNGVEAERVEHQRTCLDARRCDRPRRTASGTPDRGTPLRVREAPRPVRALPP